MALCSKTPLQLTGRDLHAWMDALIGAGTLTNSQMTFCQFHGSLARLSVRGRGQQILAVDRRCHPHPNFRADVLGLFMPCMRLFYRPTRLCLARLSVFFEAYSIFLT